MQLLYQVGGPRAARADECAGRLAAVAQGFVDALREGREFTGSDWTAVFAVAGAVAQALASGRSVVPEAPT